MKNKDIEKNIKKTISASKERVWDKVEKQLFDRESSSLEMATANGNQSVAIKNNKTLIYSVIAIFLAIVVALSAFLPKLFKKSFDYTGSFFIDINPSLQVMVDKDGLVTEVVPLNEDALVLLQGLSEYEGKSSEEIAVALFELAYKSGYISPTQKDNAVLVTGSLIDESLNQKLSLKIKDSLTKKIKEKGVYCAILTDSLSDSIKQTADEFGISPSKYQLIKSAIENGVKIDQAEYTTITVREINNRIKEFGKKFNDYGGMDFDGLLEQIQEYVDGQLDVVVSILEESVRNAREYLSQINNDYFEHPYKEQIERDLDTLGGLLEKLDDETENGKDNKALYEKLDNTIKSIAQKDELIAMQFELLKPMIDQVIAKYEEVAQQIVLAKDTIAQKYNKFVADNEQKINEFVKQDGFEDDYERWLEEVYASFHDNWDKVKQDWQNNRKEN